MNKQNSIESRLALDMLGESRLSSHQRRYEVVQRFIKIYKILPALDQIVRDLPKNQYIIDNVTVPDNVKDEIEHFENRLDSDQNDTDAIAALDNLYDSIYRN